MRLASPLRYPGGKSSLAGLLSAIRRLNGLGSLAIAEPFGGGAGASLTLLYQEETHEIHINDADPAVHAIWWSLINENRKFTKMIATTRVSMAEWRRQRDLYRTKRSLSTVRRGFSAFYLNRCNRSGIIVNGGPIGGVRQTGQWKLGARFNRKELVSRCERIAEYSGRIIVTAEDGLQFTRRLDPAHHFFFIDPPYFNKGPELYLNGLDEEYHMSLSAQLKHMQKCAWVLTYDDCPQVRQMYTGWARVRPFTLRYAAAVRRAGRELLITPKWLDMPARQPSEAVLW